MATWRVRNADRDAQGDVLRIGNSRDGNWAETRDRAVQDIRQGLHSYYVDEAGHRADVRAVPNASGWGYHLRTDADATSKNNLDNLPPLGR